MSSILFAIVLAICRAALMAVRELPEGSPHRRIVLHQIKRLRAEFQPSSTPSAIDRTEKLGHLVDWFEAGAKADPEGIRFADVIVEDPVGTFEVREETGRKIWNNTVDAYRLNPIIDTPRTRDARIHPKPGDRINLDDGTVIRVETIAETFGREVIHGSRLVNDDFELPFMVSLNAFRKMTRRTA